MHVDEFEYYTEHKDTKLDNNHISTYDWMPKSLKRHFLVEFERKLMDIPSRSHSALLIYASN